jgi:hypothetical protein
MLNFPHQSWTPIADKLLKAFAAGDVVLAEALKDVLLTALCGHARHNELDWQLVSALNKVSNCYTRANQFEEAVEIQTNILDAQKAVLRSGCPEIIDTAMKICNLAFTKSCDRNAYQTDCISTAA